MAVIALGVEPVSIAPGRALTPVILRAAFDVRAEKFRSADGATAFAYSL